MQRDYAYYRQIFEQLAKPFAFIDLDLLDQNVRQVLARGGTKRIRLASKSIRSVAMLRRILDADTRFQGIMCYKRARSASGSPIRASTICSSATPPGMRTISPPFFAKCVAQGKQITLMLDSVEHVKHLACHGATARGDVCRSAWKSIVHRCARIALWRLALPGADSRAGTTDPGKHRRGATTTPGRHHGLRGANRRGRGQFCRTKW